MRRLPEQTARGTSRCQYEGLPQYDGQYGRRAGSAGECEQETGSQYGNAEQLEELLKLCREVLANHSKAVELLPTTDGFFFGSTEYDEYYFSDIEDTADILEKTLGFLDDREHHKDYNWRIIYQASW